MNHLNESFKSNTLQDFFNKVKEFASKNKGYQDLYFIYNGKSQVVGWFGNDSQHNKFKMPLSDIPDTGIHGNKVYSGEEIKQFIKPQGEFNIKSIADRTSGNMNLSCLVACTSKHYNQVNFAVLFNQEGTNAIRMMYQKKKNRNETSTPGKLSDNQLKIINWKQMYAYINNSYKKYKSQYGDQKAMELTNTVNKLSTNPSVIQILQKERGQLTKTEVQAYLYSFLLNLGEMYKFTDFMKKDKRFQQLFDKFHPNTNA